MRSLLQVVAETDEPFVPVPDELIVNLRESREAVEALLDNLASSFASTTTVSPLVTIFSHLARQYTNMHVNVAQFQLVSVFLCHLLCTRLVHESKVRGCS